jgi:hypothetical protein
MLVNSFKLLSNNCSAKKAYLFIQAKSLKIPVKSLNYSQTIVRRKMRVSPFYCRGNKVQNACEKYKLKKYQWYQQSLREVFQFVICGFRPNHLTMTFPTPHKGHSRHG